MRVVTSLVRLVCTPLTWRWILCCIDVLTRRRQPRRSDWVHVSRRRDVVHCDGRCPAAVCVCPTTAPPPQTHLDHPLPAPTDYNTQVLLFLLLQLPLTFPATTPLHQLVFPTPIHDPPSSSRNTTPQCPPSSTPSRSRLSTSPSTLPMATPSRRPTSSRPPSR